MIESPSKEGDFSMHKVKFLICYDGSNYYGFQRQVDKMSIQEMIESTLSKIMNQKMTITGAGRTDRGVHAKAQVACATFDHKPNTDALTKSLNALLPKDIRILSSEIVDSDFHPRYSAKEKIYHYSVVTDKILDPFKRHTHYHHPYGIDLDLIEKAIPLFIGTKDFSAFANCVGKNSKVPNTVKTLYSIKLDRFEGGFSLTFHGNGFLYKMVRNISGSLIDAGSGRVSLERLEEILLSKDNKHRLFQAPPTGLCLEMVRYPLSLMEEKSILSST